MTTPSRSPQLAHTLAAPRPGPLKALHRWSWWTTLVRGALAVLVARWLVSHLLPMASQAMVLAATWAALAAWVLLRWIAGLADGLARARDARARGRIWPARLVLLLVPAELIGVLRLAAVTAAGCLAWLLRRPAPSRPDGLRLEDRRKGFYDGMFAMNVAGFVPEIPLAALFMSSIREPWLHVAVHGLELALLVALLGDRWLVHAGGHVLTPTHLDLRAGARAAARVPLAAIAAIEPLGKDRPQDWCRARGVHPADTGRVSVLDRPNVVVSLHPGSGLTWSRLQAERPVPRHLFVYLDEPAALAPAVAAARAVA